MNEQMKIKLDEIVKSVINPENVSEIFSRKLFMVNSPCHKWSFNNQMILLFNGAFDARGFQQWKAVGRKVVKGCKAIQILAPCTKNFIVEDPEDETKKIKKTVVSGFRWINVFKYEDTTGEEIEAYKQVMESESKKKDLPLIEVAEKLNLNVTYAPTVGGYYGYYSDSAKKISLATDDEQVFFHELAHAVDYELGTATRGKGQKVDNEIVAELTACFLASLYGKRADINETSQYIKHYAPSEDKESLMAEITKYMKRVEDIITFIYENK